MTWFSLLIRHILWSFIVYNLQRTPHYNKKGKGPNAVVWCFYCAASKLSCVESASLLCVFWQQPHSIVQRRLMEGNVPRLRREAHDASALTRSPLADHKDGGGGVGGGDGGEEQRSESTADDSAEERESPEESERSLRTDEEEEEEEEEETEEEDGEAAAKRAPDPAKTGEGTASPPPPLAALVVQCKVPCVFVYARQTRRKHMRPHARACTQATAITNTHTHATAQT